MTFRRRGYRHRVQSCYGMLALSSVSLPTVEILLWNPSCRLAKQVPNSCNDFGNVSMVTVGFGRDTEVEEFDFKIVKIIWLESGEMKAEVYSTKLDCWKILDTEVIEGWNEESASEASCCIVNGNPYWSGCFPVEYEGGELDEAVFPVKFDSSTDEFHLIEEIPPLEALVGIPLHMEYQGKLALAFHSVGEEGWLEGVDIWSYCEEKTKWKHREKIMITLKGDDRVRVDNFLECYSSERGLFFGRSGNSGFILDTRACSVTEIDFIYMSDDLIPYEGSLAGLDRMLPAQLEVSDLENVGVGGMCVADGFVVYRVTSERKSPNATCKYTLMC